MLDIFVKKFSFVKILQVRGYPTTRQIISTYIIEQVSVEITLTLAPNHPLGITKVEGNEAVSIYKRFTNWVKQMNMFLSHQVRILIF